MYPARQRHGARKIAPRRSSSPISKPTRRQRS